ncbi:hypothetical protein [Microbulbifer sp. JMSA008]|uniref:hypothetical protein n=1 Tax=Microbulbifer sp. JMSA008 TaxID=3243373 RepID=UPI00403A2FEA
MKKDIAVFLFDLTGKMAEPWLNAGYECWIVDIQHPESYENQGITDCGNLKKVHANLLRPWLPPFERERIAFVAAFPPCDHLAVSGARWFKGKGLRLLSDSISMFATAAEFCEWSGAPYLIENPVSNIASHWRKSDYRFQPYQFTSFCLEDNYNKLTCLWVGGGFIMPEPSRAQGLDEPDNRIHTCAPGPDRANLRSETPRGFAQAVFEANRSKVKAAA